MADRSQHPGQIMETQTRYDLNAAIENWRAELAAQPNLTMEVRRELETHLRDAIAGFQQRGLNDEESFWLACKRVGQPPRLGEEFMKINPAVRWQERVFWMALILFSLQIWILACRFLVKIPLIGMYDYFPKQLDRMGGSIFIFLTSFLPILAFAVYFVRGGIKPLIQIFQFLFRSRLIFITTALTLILIIHSYFFDWPGTSWIGMGRTMGGQIMSSTGAMMTAGNYISNNFLSQFCMDFLFTERLPLILVFLIALFMPAQRRLTLKRA
jgi:hypothetical protein